MGRVKEITQRQLRNDSGEVMRGLDEGETYVVMRIGTPVGELTPLRTSVRPHGGRDGHVPGAPQVNYKLLGRDLDAVASQDAEPVAERPARGLIDTSVMLDLERLDPEGLPIELAISAVTLAELAAGPMSRLIPRSAGFDRIACSGPRRRSMRSRSTRSPRGHTDASTQ